MIDWPSAALRAAEYIAIFVIGTGLVQTLFYIVQLLFAGRALAQRPAVPAASLLWRRYAGGLSEPLSMELASGVPQIFTRNGVIRLYDQNGDGEAFAELIDIEFRVGCMRKDESQA